MRVSKVGLHSLFFTAVFVAAYAGPGFAEPACDLNEALVKAMEMNPDVLAAKANVQLAESKLAKARLETAQKVIALYGELETLKLNVRNCEARVEETTTRQQNLFSELEQTRKELEAEKQGVNECRKITDSERAIMAKLLERVGRLEAIHHDFKGKAETAGIECAEAHMRFFSAKEKYDKDSQLIERQLSYLIGDSSASNNEGASSSPSGKGVDRSASARPIQLPRGPLVEKIRKALTEVNVRAEFIEMPLSDVVGRLSKACKIPIQGLGDEADSTIITMNIGNASLAMVLQRIEDDWGPCVKFVVRDYGILMVDPEQAEEEGYMSAIEFAYQGKPVNYAPMYQGEPAK